MENDFDRNLMTIFDAVQSVTAWNGPKVHFWLMSANPLLGDASPFELISLGRTYKVMRLVENLKQGEMP